MQVNETSIMLDKNERPFYKFYKEKLIDKAINLGIELPEKIENIDFKHLNKIFIAAQEIHKLMYNESFWPLINNKVKKRIKNSYYDSYEQK